MDIEVKTLIPDGLSAVAWCGFPTILFFIKQSLQNIHDYTTTPHPVPPSRIYL